jgi:hypothetical protein
MHSPAQTAADKKRILGLGKKDANTGDASLLWLPSRSSP